MEYPQVCWEVPNGPSATAESNGPPFPTVLQFASFDRAVESIYFNVIGLLLITISNQIELGTDNLVADMRAADKLGPFSNPLLPPGEGYQEGYALEICRTVQCMVHGERDSIGSLSLLFPLRVASHHLQHRPDIQASLKWVLGKLTAKKGFKMGEHVMNLSRAGQ